VFDEDSIQVVDIAAHEEHFVSTSADPQIHLKPRAPLAPGWWQFVLKLTGELVKPCVYLDFGSGYSQTWAIPLVYNEAQPGYRAVAWVPATVQSIRLDPHDAHAHFGVTAFLVDPLTDGQLEMGLTQPSLASPPAPPRLRPLWRRGARRLMRRPQARALALGGDPLVVFSEFTHLCGASIRLDEICESGDEGHVEVYAFDEFGLELVRTASFDPTAGDHDKMHLYWDVIADSKLKFFLLLVKVTRAGERVAVGRARSVHSAKVFHAPPEPYAALPQALLFSPVTQCNLNCTHCISRYSRDKFASASERVWEAVEQVTREKLFMHLSTDYSGDILFDEVKHGGILTRLIKLDVPYRIDTNAVCLDEPIGELLLGSKLFEIGFSIDSMDPEIYLNVRRGAIPLDQVLAKIARFMERKRELRPDLKTYMSFVLMRSNAATIKPALAFAKEHGIDAVTINPMVAFTEDMVEEILVWDVDAYTALYRELNAEAARIGIALGMQTPVRRWVDKEAHSPCMLPWGSAVVLGNGDVMACCIPGTRMGNLNEASLPEIWHGPVYQAFRARVNSLDPPEPCRNCSWSRVHNNRMAYAPALHKSKPVRALDKRIPIAVVDSR